MPARILVVDDHPLTREALAALLRSRGFELAGVAADGDEAIAAAAETQPDLILLDLLMPGLDGLSALPRLREAAPGCEVVDPHGLRIRRRPARRDSRRRRGLSPQDRVARSHRGLPRRCRARRGRALGAGRAKAARAGAHWRPWFGACPTASHQLLSARELEVLLLLDEHHGTEEIAQRLFISEHTVRSHVKSLLRKLERLVAT